MTERTAAQDTGATEHDFTDFDPELFARNLARFVDDGGRLLGAVTQRSQDVPAQVNQSDSVGHIASLFAEVAQAWMERPDAFAEAQGALMRRYADLFTTMGERLNGAPVDDVATPSPGDKRFRDEDWSANPYFDFWKQAYLITSDWAQNLVENSAGLEDHTRHKASFYLRMLTSAIAPTNFPATNPEVVRETIRTSGENLISGMGLLAKDLERSDDVLRISQTDSTAFAVGENLALTPGKVVFQNKLFQLIQYAPATDTVHAKPFLLVPPWINKFYVLDLTPEKSFIRYVVAQGFTVFVISWVNPDASLADTTFEDYMRKGILKAAHVASEICDGKKCNVLGYCVGGTLLGTTLAWLAAGKRNRRNRPFASATFLTTQLDFTSAGDLQVFVDEDQICALEETMDERGYLDGSKMAGAFNMLRPGDLIFPYVVNNYLLGKKPSSFDLLFWNQDSTRMPRANHLFYLREFYQNNRLAKGEMTFGGRDLDLGAVDIPIYELAAREDHIAPPGSVYTGARLVSADDDNVTYVLAGSGHIAGVVNPPAKNKYQYWTNPDGLTAPDYVGWLEGAEETAGSWWPHWIDWLRKQSGKQVPARVPGVGPFDAIEDAPGSYVRVPS